MRIKPGTVGIICDFAGRYSEFMASVSYTNFPPDTNIVWAIGSNIGNNSNFLVENMVGDWLWILGDDHTWDPNLLLSLLAHDKDIVVPLCLRKTSPFTPVLYEFDEEKYYPINLHDYKPGLVEVAAAGSAGMLVKRHVFDSIEKPWFSFNRTYNGQPLGEDISFCHQAREAGFKIYADLTLPLGHIIPAWLNPYYDKGWGLKVQLDQGKTTINVGETGK